MPLRSISRALRGYVYASAEIVGSMTVLSPATRRLIANLGSNYAYVVLMALITLFVVPVYVFLLGITDWGKVSTCLTLQNFLFSLDIAIGPLMLREIARSAANGNAAAAYQRFLRRYVGTAVILFLLGLLALAVFAYYHETSAQPMSADMLWAMRLALVQFLFQFSNNAAMGYWNGQERQGFANLRFAGFALVKHALALTLLLSWRTSAVVYILPFALVSAIECAANHHRVRRELAARAQAIKTTIVSSGWRDSVGFGVAALLGFATTQIDRGFLSFVLPASEYGIYFLLSAPMLSLFSLQMPIQRAFLPRMATTVSPRQVVAFMLKVSFGLLVLPSLVLAAFPEFVLRLWLHNAAIAAQGADVFRLLMLAVAMNAVFAPFGSLLLNRHLNGASAAINSTILLVQLLILFALTSRLGMTSGAIAWLACGLIQLACAGVIWRRVK